MRQVSRNLPVSRAEVCKKGLKMTNCSEPATKKFASIIVAVLVVAVHLVVYHSCNCQESSDLGAQIQQVHSEPSQQAQAPVAFRRSFNTTAEHRNSQLITETSLSSIEKNKTARRDGEQAAEATTSNDWTFEMVEYDLMEVLQDLRARYEDELANRRRARPPVVKVVGNSLEERRHYPQATTSEFKTTPIVIDGPLGVIRSSSSSSSSPPTVTPNSPAATVDGNFERVTPTTTKASSTISATSEDGGDELVAENGSWKYGIFDRFTRFRSSLTTTTRDPFSSFDPNMRYEVSQFNAPDCGLRTYEESDPFDFEKQAADASLTMELHIQKPKRPSLQQSGGEHKKHLSESFSDSSNQRKHDESHTEKDNDDDLHNKPAAPEHSPTIPTGGAAEQELSAGGGAELADNEFNLSTSGGQLGWLQKQLESSLQMLGLNASSSKLAANLSDFQTSGSLGSSTDAGGKMENSSSSASTLASPFSSSSANVQSSTVAGTNSEQELRARQDEFNLEGRVIGGSDARIGDSPWSVSLQALLTKPGVTKSAEYRHYCGGTIISDRYILTAAHCLDFMVGRESRLFVVAGDLNWRMTADWPHGRRFGVERLIIHSAYKSSAFGHDIGLIRTKESMRPVRADGKYIVNSVCLPGRWAEHEGREAELVGWGLFSDEHLMAETLQVAKLPIMHRFLCMDMYRRRTGLVKWLIGAELITDKQVCAGAFGRGICQGDSGSALVVNEKTVPTRDNSRGQDNNKNSRATIVGVVAFGGVRRCSYQNLPGVYMQTSKYLDWILPRVQE